MLSSPDFLKKRLILIGSEHLHDLSWQNDNLAIRRDGVIVEQISCHRIFLIIVLGEATITSRLLQKCAQMGIVLVGMCYNLGTYLVHGLMSEANTLLRRTQYVLSHQRQLSIAQCLVANKISNAHALLARIREPTHKENHSLQFLTLRLKEPYTSGDFASLMGVEWMCASFFFGGYFLSCEWQRREPRTRRDIPNFLLDIGYSSLARFIEALLRSYGFDCYLGVYHREFYQRKSLVCDVMEPFRCVIDSAMRKAYALKRINPKEFIFVNGEYQIKNDFQRKYSGIFIDAIIDHRESMYRYVQGLYRHMLAPHRHPMPWFDIVSDTVLFDHPFPSCSSSPTTSVATE